MRSRSISFLLTLVLLFTAGLLYAQETEFDQKQNALKKADRLSEWLYASMDRAGTPVQRLNFLTFAHEKAWRKPKNPDEHQAWLNLLNNLGYEQLMAGKILDAINSYEEALSWYEKNEKALEGYDLIEYTLKPLSNNYTRIGDYERALYLQKKSIAALKMAKRMQELSAVYSNMAISYRSMGNFALAENSIRTGLSFSKPDEESFILLNNILSGILEDQNRLKDAQTTIEQNIRRQVEGKNTDPYLLMGAYTVAGSINLKLSKPAAAELLYHKALKIALRDFKTNRLRERANLYIQLGKIKRLQGDPKKALSLIQSGLTGMGIAKPNAKLYGDNMLMDAFEQMALSALMLHSPDEAILNFKRSLQVADKMRNEFANDKTKERLQAYTKSITEQAIETCYQLNSKKHNPKYLNEALDLAESSKSRTLSDQIRHNQQLLSIHKKDPLFRRKQHLEQTIVAEERSEIETATLNPNIDALKYELSIVDKQIRNKYPQFNTSQFTTAASTLLKNLPDTKVLEFFFGKNAVYRLTIEKNKVVSLSKIADATPLKTQVLDFSNRYFHNGPSAMLNAPKDFYMASYSIYNQLFKALRLRKSESLTIIPDEVLGYLSFDGFLTTPAFSPNVSSWPFLIRNNKISYAYSLNALIQQSKPVRKPGFTGLFITHQKGSNRPLKAILQEVNAIKKQIDGHFLMEEQVNPASFTQAFQNSNVLHIGTHAYLSGPNQEPTLDFGKEKLFLFELSAKKQAPQLVVLSACQTADGVLSNGEGIISLARGFSAVGTGTTIAGLWNVNDEAAAQISSDIYTQLLQNKSPGMALHQAKLDWLNRPQSSDAYYFPYYWDSFIVMGNDAPVQLSSPFKLWIPASIVIFLVLACAGLFYYRKSVIKRQT